jgi:tryptophan-rich sensory protein
MARTFSVDAIKLAVSIAVCLAAGVIGSLFTTPKIPGWYASLAKPSFTPPSWLFGPVWTALYILMGISLFLVWRKGLAVREVRIALVVFLVQLVLNAAWSLAFFGGESPGAGLAVIIPLWIGIVASIALFAPISKGAAILLVPYLLWVSFATILNGSIYLLNR